MRVVISLAGPPRGKGRGRATVRTGKDGQSHATVYPDGKTVKYEAQLRLAGMHAMEGRPPTIQPVRVRVVVALPIAPSWPKKKQAAARVGHIHPDGRGSGDADNFLKILDALNGVVFADDCQIVEASVRKVYAEAPSLSVEIETIAAPVLPEVRAADGPRPAADLFAGVPLS